MTDENYFLAIENLKEIYGRKDLLIDFYVRKLLKLVMLSQEDILISILRDLEILVIRDSTEQSTRDDIE